MMNNNRPDEAINATLSITKSNDDYTYILEGIPSKPIESRCSGELGESIELVQRWITDEMDEHGAEKLGLPKSNERFIAQQNKIDLSAIGFFIYENLLPKKISSLLKNSDKGYFSLKIDDSLVDIPWELMYDGKDFFCMKYAIGRRINFEKQRKDHLKSNKSNIEVRFLLIEDPTNSLPASRNEINYLNGRLLTLPGVKLQRRGMEMRKKDFLNTLSVGNFDILHFSGHGFFDSDRPNNSYLLFYDDENPCYAHEIAENLEDKAPALIFSNACTSAQAIVGQQGLVHAFLSSGTSAYIGSIWPVDDQLAGMIGSEFYRYIIYGKTVGEALRLARLNSYKKFGWTSISWAAYILYGEPTKIIFHSKRT